MTTYDVIEITITGRKLGSSIVEADSFDNAIAEYVQRHSDPKTIYAADVWELSNGRLESYSLSKLSSMGMPVGSP